MKRRRRAWLAVLISVLCLTQLVFVQGALPLETPKVKVAVPPILSPETSKAPKPATENFVLPGTDKVVIPGADPTKLTPKKPDSKPLPPFEPPAPKKSSGKSSFVQGTSKEIADERTAAAKVFRNADGTKTAKVYGSPVHFKDAEGKWKDIDPKLIPDAGGFKNTAGPFTTRFATRASSPELTSIEADGHKVTMALEQAGEVPGVPVGEEITYRQVRPGVDLHYRVGKTHVKEELILSKAPTDAAGSTFRFTLDPGELAPKQEPNGGIGLYGDSERPIFVIPAARMWDSNVDPKSNEPVYGPATLTLSQLPEGWIIEVSADAAWLADSARKYPVHLDPSFNYWGAQRMGGGLDAYVTDAYPNSTFDNDWSSALGRYQNKLGYYDASTGTNWDYLFYDLGFLNGKHILNADWWGFFMWAYYPDTPTLYRLIRSQCCWWSGNITWNNQPGRGPEVTDGYAARNTWDSKNITGWVTNWTNGAWQNSGITMDTFGGGTANWKKLAADENYDGSQSFIAIDYNTAPVPDVPVSPADGASFHSLSPLLDVNGGDADGDALEHYFRVCEGADAETNCIWESGWVPTDQVNVPAGELEWNKTYYWHTYSYDGVDVGYPNWVRSFRPVNSPPAVASPSAPPDGAVLTTLNPTISLNPPSDPDNDNPIYNYIRIAEGTDGLSGAVNDSGWLASPTTSWVVPPGALADGKKYYWTALSWDGYAAPAWSPVRSFRVDLGLGEKGSRPYDSLGAVSVNLSNGNLLASAASPSVSSLGGPLGLSFNYNSQTPTASGLKGDYFRDDPAHNFTGERVLTRLDSPVNFTWGQAAPYPSMNPDNFSVRWTGYVTVPSAGSYNFGTISDDGVKVWINNQLVVDRYSDQSASAAAIFGTPMTFVAGQTVPVKIEYYEHFVDATMRFWVKGPIGVGGAQGESIVPGSWLTSDLPGLPDGWTMSADPDGELSYTSAKISGQQVVLTDSSGATHTYRNTGSGWEPPEDEEGILASDPVTGLLVLQAEDGLVYNFTSEGALSSVVSALDDRKPAAPQYTWSGTPSRLTRITDPVSERWIALTYQLPGSSDCPTSPGFTAPPSFTLCKIDYGQFGAGDSLLYYSGGHLARIVDPGSEVTDFGYDASGKLTQIRDPLTNDLIASGQIVDAASDTHKTVVTYSGSKATKITGPVADSAGSPRPENSYTYQPPITKVSVAGTAPAVGYARQVTVDPGNRTIEDRDSAGKLTSFVWDQDDRLLSTTDPAGLKSTTLYDSAGRPTDTYGPGSPSEFGVDRRSSTAPHSTTAYDEGIDGLAAAWWENASIAGPPKAHTTFDSWKDWAAASPATNVPPDGFSGRLTGELNVPVAGDHNFAADVATDDGVRVFIDDKAVIDRWDTYRQSVSKDAPIAYWRLGDSSGTVADDATSNNRDGGYQNGVILNEPGRIEGDANSAIRLDGLNDYVISPNLASAFSSDSVTVELWFKAEAAGVILTEQGSPTPNSGWYDSQLEILPSGEVKARVWNLLPISLGSASFNQWHHAVLRYDKASQVLDGFLNGTRSTQYSTGDRFTPAEYGFAQNWALGAADVTNKMGTGAWFKGSIDEAVFYNKPLSDSRIQDHFKGAKLQGTASLTAGAHRIRIDYQDPGGPAKLALNWTPPAGSPAQIPLSNLKPRYGLQSSEVDADGKKNVTEYQTPELGLATATVIDPAGLNLRSTTTYEAGGTGFFRSTARTPPKGNDSKVTYGHFGATETADNPCTSGTEATIQAGLMKSSTAADPDGTGSKDSIVREYRYDSQGRAVAERVVGDSNWACTTYDSRGRITSQKDSSGKTTSVDYSVPDQVATGYKDSSNTDRTTTAKVDWLGRALSYTDENASVTRNVYDQAGRVTATYRALFAGAESQLSSLTYDSATTRLASMTEFVSGAPRTTTFSYDTAGRLDSTTRPNGVVTKDTYHSSRGWLSDISHKKNAVELSPWGYTRSPSGDISSEQTTGRTRGFTYDNAGRLTKTIQTGANAATRNYSFDQNTNRCSDATSCDGSYSYDAGDRLTSSPFASTYSYDPHGNLTTADLTKPVTEVTSAIAGSAESDATKSHTLPASASGTISASLDWQQDTASRTLDASVAALGEKSYILPSSNGTISASLTWTPETPNPNFDLYLYDQTGAEVASSKRLTGNSESLTLDVTGVGAYPDAKNFTLKVKALGLGGNFSLSYSHPAMANFDLELYNPAGTKVAEATSTSAKPEALSYSALSTGDYTLKVISRNHPGAYTATATYPRTPGLQISYDANDHATEIDDGLSLVKETLSSTGRVVRRKVTDPAGIVTEDTLFGYGDSGDSPNYSRPSGGGPITSYIEGPSGLLVIETAGTSTYPLANGHGDTAGNTDINGVFTANPETDEFGIGTTPENRLGWLGAKERYSTGGSLGLIRMGVRLYDPNLGRFLEVDPVKGGSANDYEYCFGDPINCYDLDGEVAVVLVPAGILLFKAALTTGAFIVSVYGAWKVGRAHGRMFAQKRADNARQRELVRKGRELLGRGHSEAGKKRWHEWQKGLNKHEKDLYRKGRGPRPQKRPPRQGKKR